MQISSKAAFVGYLHSTAQESTCQWPCRRLLCNHLQLMLPFDLQVDQCLRTTGTTMGSTGRAEVTTARNTRIRLSTCYFGPQPQRSWPSWQLPVKLCRQSQPSWFTYLQQVYPRNHATSHLSSSLATTPRVPQICLVQPDFSCS